MVNVLAMLMGIMDIIAGILILIFLGSHSIAIVFGILMMGKGVISLGFFGD